ncbi:Cobalt-precorrin-3B C(17)-methyltransferase [Candidatus Nitrosocosmicus oleophilus]|jgi:precorrin-3B C17-methyltransferase / cobalt-factor III methyltransferase|uniref:Cobalt-precorrin-3B C(17)-methyltransferase n=1 Tax=Candidatus Nitrosocosmicus oleophilus TaxID=1353260 RepID=A0A654M4N1_9ARCH|nr:precorrin-3B C(17)-methyltransferase [Candidatus Nitrosocosmicus oleophilus]ALI37713.1 Cobalt-precorrin-3B C(17)-methyltransferase [Candidatus Nitrosocosmicus oleophilus]
MNSGKLYVVGVGPGHHDHMTFRAKQVIEESQIIVGYETYVSLVEDLISGKEVYRYPMTQEVDRANQAIDFAEKGGIVSLVSSGDPGIYGMVGLIYEILAEKGWKKGNGIDVECVPGVSSLNSCSALIGSPLMTDFAVVSMSDLLVPWEIIVKRVEAAALGDFVTVVYNPSSKKRIHQLKDAREIFLKYRNPETPVAIVKGAFRDSQSIVLTNLEKMLDYPDMMGMITTIIIGNSSSYNYDDMMINPRGYRSKYQLVK